MCKKTMSRAISFLLAVVLLVGIRPIQGQAVEDTTPPVLIDVTLSVTTVEVPGDVEIIVEATDDISGVASGLAWFISDRFSRDIMVKLAGTYWDDEQQEEVAYPDGKLHGTVSLNQYLAEQTYTVSFELRDNAGNYSTYNSTYGPWPEDLEPVQLEVKNSNVQDRRFPKLNNVTFSASTVKAPGQVEVIVDATDDLSGLANEGHVRLYCKEADDWIDVYLNSQYWDSDLEQYIAYADGMLHGTLIVYAYQRAGMYMLDYVSVYDNAGNYCTYDRSDDSYGVHSKPMSDELKFIQFEVISDNLQDYTPPVLNDIILSATTVTVPGQVEVIVDATDDVAGISFGSLGFYCYETDEYIEAELLLGYINEETGHFVAYEDGKLHAMLDIDLDVPVGTYRLRYIEVFDNVLNHYYFIANETCNDPQYDKLMALHLIVQESAKSGWVSSDNRWYYYQNGQMVKSQWIFESGKWYYFGGNGAMATGWTQVGGKWYYMNAEGEMQIGWVGDSGKWYFMNANGVMHTGWLDLGGKWYYMNASGVMQIGTVTIEGKQHQFNASGVWQGEITKSGWVSENGKWYYYKNGAKVTGWLNLSGKWYYMDANGVMVTGTVTIEGKKHQFNASGVWQGEITKSGWVQEDGKWCFYKNGAKVTGWLQDGSKWYYFDANGVMLTGWVKIGGVWYYLQPSGAMATGWNLINGSYYYFYSSGVMKTGWLNSGGKRYFFRPDGAMATGWVEYAGNWYYMNESGAMVTGTYTIKGTQYTFDANGVWIP